MSIKMNIRMAGIFDAVSEQMKADLAKTRAALTHPGLKGSSVELVVLSFLREHLPANLDVSSGVAIDASGGSTKQLDVIVSDAAGTPIFYRSGDVRVIPIEGIYAIIEVKTYLKCSDLPEIYENMRSVRSLHKTAYVDEHIKGPIIRRPKLYGREWDIWPTSYFVFAFESDSLQSIATTLLNLQQKADFHERIDCIGILDKGLVLNQSSDGTIDALPGPDTKLKFCATDKSLFLFYSLICRYLMQAWIPSFNIVSYWNDCFGTPVSVEQKL